MVAMRGREVYGWTLRRVVLGQWPMRETTATRRERKHCTVAQWRVVVMF